MCCAVCGNDDPAASPDAKAPELGLIKGSPDEREAEDLSVDEGWIEGAEDSVDEGWAKGAEDSVDEGWAEGAEDSPRR